ncbi:hypothetical protein [uncultured Pseudacidovorax sp.]|uniref:hypothetical protein n=1 Tax=uncultured Pseudacidovorax sp. TaxID=679313 RepID=UPI0025FBAAA3|nr:hypothetical protein [uncultured Pseudacidovorax sp.]
MTLNLPITVAIGSAAAGVGAAVTGVYLLAGAGWALITCSLPLLALSTITFRGLLRGATE